MQKITIGENTFDVKAVILMRDRDATLERAFRKKIGAAHTIFIPLNTQDNVTKFQDRMQNGYELLCMILPDGRTKYTVSPKHLEVAEEIGLTVDKVFLWKMDANANPQ